MSKIKIGITIGDMNGIGPEVIIKALSHQKITDHFIPIIYGSSKVVAYYKNIVNNHNFSFVSIKNTQNAAYNKVNVINAWDDNTNITVGKATEESGKNAFVSIQRAVEDAKAKNIDALVTAPINKNAMKLAGFEHVGHTEYLTEVFKSPETVMTMVSDDIVVALATNHLPIRRIHENLDKNKLIRKMKILSKSLRQDFAQEKPTIAVLGLNPHAGDDGVIGKEEIDYIKPAIIEAKNNGVLVAGPYPADGFFGNGDFRKVKAILAMYHDQGLVPFKLLSFGKGVNFTAGLPIIRTSPDHGTAYPIAGMNVANPDSMRKAMFLAKDLFLNRKQYLEDNRDPIKKAPKHQEEIQE